MQSLMTDLGLKVQVHLFTDASAAIGIASRQGLGRIRHLATTDLWLQQRVKSGDVVVHKVMGEVNPGDLMTKPLDGHRMLELLSLMNASFH